MQIRSLGQEDPLEKEMATHPSVLAWEISGMEEPGRLQSMGLQKSWTSSRLKTTTDKTRESALGFDRDTKPGRGVRKLNGRKKGRLQVCPDGRLLM